jgi:VanZ family protein
VDHRKLGRLFWCAAWVAVGLLALVTLVPAQERPQSGLSSSLEHLAAYAVTAAAFSFASATQRWKILLVLSLYAGILEFLQHYAPGRHARFGDFLMSCAGVFVGVSGAWLLARLEPLRRLFDRGGASTE